jgi:hypothetical protein
VISVEKPLVAIPAESGVAIVPIDLRTGKERSMTKIPSYNLTPLMEQINRQLLQRGHPNAFAIADFGEGPILTYRKMHSRIDILSVCLITEGKRIEFTHLSKPPYFIALAQDKPDTPILTTIYREASDAVLEQGMDTHLTGQVLAYGYSATSDVHTFVHAVYLPTHSNVFALAERKNSLLLEGHPEVCRHLVLCGSMMDTLLRKDKGMVCHEN